MEENGEMVATVYANANTSSIGFIVRQGGDSWTSKDPGSDRFIEDVYTDLAMVKSGTLHVYCTSGVSDFTVVEGDDVVKDETSEEVQGSQYPIVINVHYTREDGNYEGWDVFQWNGVKVTAFEVGENEAVATIYANSNSADIGFIVRYGGDSWTDREWVNAETGDRLITGLSDIVTGTVDVYVDHANPSETKIELGDDVIYTGDEHIDIRVHYTREDGNYEGWDVFAWNNQSVTAFEVGENEAVATIRAYSNSADIGFIVRYGGDSWTDREWVNAESGDRTVSGLSGIYCGTVDVYVDHANPSVTTIVFGTVARGTGEAPEYDITIKVHYYREDGAYPDWEVHMWNGVESLSSTRAFDETDENGWAVATYYADASDTWVGFIIKKPDWTKDPDGDRKIDISDVLNGTVHVYAKSGSALEDFETDKSEATLGAKVTAAIYDTLTGVLTVTTSMPIEGDLNSVFTLEGPDGEMTITSVTQVEGTSSYVVTYEGEITADDVYTIYYNGAPCVVTVPNTYSTETFEAEFTYTGNDLGATWTKEATCFRLWAPTATAVSVNLYESGTEGTDDLIQSVEMTADVNGTWIATVEGDLNGTYYTYSVTRKGETVEACDPYARTTGVNGNRAMVIDLDSTDPEGWENDTNPNAGLNFTDAVIWELHVRDFSIDTSSGISDSNRGKYLAFTEEGTTNSAGQSTGVDYMVDLGINYVHLLPVYDINSVDETVGGYNWGYDPKNYNVPEGSYSTDPYNGAVRVNEFKQMVQSLHDNDIGVIMDVVYNHVADASAFCFNQIVPGYFSRIHDDGSYQSNSGCGNDTASERAMVQKYIVDSICYWADEYHIDGFRWDLVGLIDYETINAVMEEVHKTHPDVVFYGEGWEMCSWTTKDGYVDKMTIQNNADKVNSEAGIFAFFNDTVRNVLHGGVFDSDAKGYVSGAYVDDATYTTLVESFLGASHWGSKNTVVPTPLQTVNYASCHDNYTLIDNITLDSPEASREEVVKMNNLAAAYYITAQGVPFMQAGEEMLRSKPDADSDTGYNHNSYASGDEINSIKWDSLATEEVQTTYNYYKGLIAFRKAHAALRMTDAAEVAANVLPQSTGDNQVLAFHILGGNGETSEGLFIAFNAKNEAYEITLPEGKWEVYVTGSQAGTTALAVVEGTVTVEAISSVMLVKVQEKTPDEPEQPECLSKNFTDLDLERWYHPYTDYVLSNGLMKGMTDTTFEPNTATTRAMLVTTLYRLAGEPKVTTTSTFTDVESGRYYSKAIAWAQAEGIANGLTDTTFGPNEVLTREQAATFLYRYLKVEAPGEADLSVFTDADSIHKYAKNAVTWAVANGLFEGFEDNTLQPAGELTRAQLAKLLTVVDTMN